MIRPAFLTAVTAVDLNYWLLLFSPLKLALTFLTLG